MNTMNVSLTSEQVGFVDQLVAQHGFANRSEFVRSILRLIRFKPELVVEVKTFPFVAPKERSVKKIVSEFAKTQKYSRSFLADLKAGLAESSYFQE